MAERARPRGIKKYACERCGKMFRAPSMLRDHNNRKNVCITAFDPQMKNACVNCGHRFSTKSNLTRHKAACRVVPAPAVILDIEIVPDEIINPILPIEVLDPEVKPAQEMLQAEMDPELEQLELPVPTQDDSRDLDDILDEIRRCTRERHDNINHMFAKLLANIALVNTIVASVATLRAYDNPCIDHIPIKDYCMRMNNARYDVVLELIDAIWFDSEHPENHSLRVSDASLLSFDGFAWSDIGAAAVIEEMHRFACCRMTDVLFDRRFRIEVLGDADAYIKMSTRADSITTRKVDYVNIAKLVVNRISSARIL